jgi:hypothetical protein
MITPEGKIVLDRELITKLKNLNLPEEVQRRLMSWLVTEAICGQIGGEMPPCECDNPLCHNTATSLPDALLDEGWRTHTPSPLILCQQCSKWADEALEQAGEDEWPTLEKWPTFAVSAEERGADTPSEGNES